MRAARHSLDAALAEGQAVASVLSAASSEDWANRTDCPEWSVRDMAAHLVAQAEGVVNPLLMLRRMRRGARRYPQRSGLDAYTAIQIADHAGQAGPELVVRFVTLWPRAVRAMRRTPGMLRAVSADSGVPGHGKISIGYLYDDILPRDLLMHRIDLCRALGVPFVPGGHEGPIVDAVMRDLAATWRGPAITLTLDGPGGGTWLLGDEPVGEVGADLVEFLRSLAGRQPAVRLTHLGGDVTDLPTLAAARVLF